MADQPGFFDSLIGSSQNEQSVYNQQLGAQISAGGRMAEMMYGLGRMGTGGLVSGVTGMLNKEKGQLYQDRLVSSANGIDVSELQARRRIRKETAGVTDDGTYSSRRKMAETAARIANEEGSAPALARALSALKSLDLEQAEFDKLNAQKEAADAQKLSTVTQNAWDSDGNPVTGMVGLGPDGKGGMWTEVNGQMIHRPWSEDFSQVDPRTGKTGLGKSGEPITPDQVGIMLKRVRGTSNIGAISNQGVTAANALDKTKRIVSTLGDLSQYGGVESVIGTSGKVVTAVDNFVRNVSGVVNTFAPRGAAEDKKAGVTPSGEVRSWNGLSDLKAMAGDAANQFADYIQLPEGVERTSAAAQQHRAAIMEMAYMAARLAEPSNRGLSDNDIKNALARIAGDTSNPQVMMRRFLEMQVDAEKELNNSLRGLHGSLGPTVSDDMINRAVVGAGYQDYVKEKQALFNQLGITQQDDGRIVFSEDSAFGSDVQPGQGTPPSTKTSVDELDDDAFLESIGLGGDE